MKNRSRRKGKALPVASPPMANIDEASFRNRKLMIALSVMGAGMLIALSWAAVQGWGLGKGYPYNTFLFSPRDRFNDFSDMTLDASRANPFLDPFGIYLPFAWLFFRAFSEMPPATGLTTFLFIGVGGLFVLLLAVLVRTVTPPWKRVLLTFSFLALSYPVLISIDRANLEIYLAGLVGAALYFFSRARYRGGTLCLLASVSFKFYPAIFLLLLLRQRRVEYVAGAVMGFLVVILISMAVLSLPLQAGLGFYGRNLVFLDRAYVLQNDALEGCSSLWNVYKIGLVTVGHLGLIAPVDFSFDGRFIGISYTVYSIVTALLGVILAYVVCLVEREFLRCAVALLLFVSIATPLGADYRLLYANMALVAVILLENRRPFDVTMLIFLALAMVPKKEIFLAYAGRTETGAADVSIQVLLDPLLIFAALILLVHDSFRMADSRWIRLRFQRLIRAVLPRPKRA